IAASDDLRLPQFGNGAAGTPNRVADIGGLGQGPYRGARIRGAWYQTDNPVVYDPSSRFGETFDSMPDLNVSIPPDRELIVSAPGSGKCARGTVDVSAG